MLPSDRVEFIRVLNGLAAIKPGARLTPESLDIYWAALNSWSMKDFRAAATQLALNMEFMPQPYHFDQLRKIQRMTSAEAWEVARTTAREAIKGGQIVRGLTCGVELIDKAVRGIGDYGAIALSEVSKLPLLERRFADHYESIQDAQDVRDALPQLAAPNSVRCLNRR